MDRTLGRSAFGVARLFYHTTGSLGVEPEGGLGAIHGGVGRPLLLGCAQQAFDHRHQLVLALSR